MQARRQNVISLRAPCRAAPAAIEPSQLRGRAIDAPDLNNILAMVSRAGDAIVESRQRIIQLESQLRDVSERASRAMDKLQNDVESLQRQLQDSEARRDRAEDGLLRLCAAIREQFPSARESDAQSPEQETERRSSQAS